MEEENNKLDIIIRQTNYSIELAREKLQENNGDHIKVIKEYFGITEKKAPKVASVNQEIYRQLRKKLDTNMNEYRARVEKGEAKNVI